jgi:peptidoglycan lytic transglycosylase
MRLYYRVDYQPLILREAERHQVSPHLIAAVIFAESRFRSTSQSDVGAMGLMQLMPETAAEMAEKEGLRELAQTRFLEPEVNIRLGSRYLSELLQRFPTEREALAAYNAGPTLVASWRREGRGIAFPETQAYVDNVQRYKVTLEQLYPHWKKGS